MIGSDTGRPEPVMDAAKLAAAVSGAVTAIGTAFVLVGWTTADTVNNWAVVAGGIVTAVGTLITVALPIITAVGARAQVTPLAAPVGMDGVPLITAAAADQVALAAPSAEPGKTTSQIPAVLSSWRPPLRASTTEPTPIGAEAAAVAAADWSREAP